MKYRSRKTGFTLVEVALFLALSSLLMIGIIAGANISISNQRYNDAVNNFADLIRGTYADVLNVSSEKNPEVSTDKAGRTKTAVYGKLISIGECVDFTRSCDSGTSNVDDTIYIYDIVGWAVNSSFAKGNRAIEMLYNPLEKNGVDANIIDRSDCSAGSSSCEKFYRMNTYKLPWDARVEDKDRSRFRAAIFIVRSPSTGSVRTYTHLYGSNDKGFHLLLNTNYANNDNSTDGFSNYMRLVGHQNNNYGENGLTMCIDSDDNTSKRSGGTSRRGLKITDHASSSSAVMLTEMDLYTDSCQ